MIKQAVKISEEKLQQLFDAVRQQSKNLSTNTRWSASQVAQFLKQVPRHTTKQRTMGVNARH